MGGVAFAIATPDSSIVMSCSLPVLATGGVEGVGVAERELETLLLRFLPMFGEGGAIASGATAT